jgi:hypothetical protein
MRLADALEEYCCEPLRGAFTPHPGLAWHGVSDCAASLKKRLGEAEQIEQISRDTLPLLEEIADHIEDQSRVNRAIVRIDALRARMNDLGACYDLITQLTQTTELKRFQADRKITAAEENSTERQRLQVLRDVENVRGIAEAAAEFQRLVRDVIERIATQVPSKREAA